MNSIGLTQESNNFICNTTFIFSEHSDFRIQKIAFEAFLANWLIASVKEPDGLKRIPKYLYSLTRLTVFPSYEKL
jgi:hypothetical protein